MNGKAILIGFIIFTVGFIANVPGIILGMAGSPIKSEGDVMIKVLDELQETSIVQENSQAKNILKETKGSISLLNSIPTIIMVLGILIAILGLFV